MFTPLFFTIALMIFIAALGVGFWARSRRARPLVGASGLMLVPLGLYLLGITELTFNGITSLVDWVRYTVWSDVMTWGIGLLIGGLVLSAVAFFLPKEPAELRAEPVQQPGKDARASVARSAEPKAVGPSRPMQTAKPTAQQTKPVAAKGNTGGLSQEDLEIAELLKKRGIT